MKLNSSILTALLLLLLFTVRAEAQHTQTCYIDDPAAEPRERFADFKKSVIDIRIVPQEKYVTGKVTHTFSPLRHNLDSLWLDAPGINIKSVKLSGGGKIKTDTSDQKGVALKFKKPLVKNEQYTLTIEYDCRPKKGMYFTGWNNNSRKQVWTQGQGVDNRHWFPHFDDLSERVLTETIIEFPKGYKLLSNGTLQSKTDKDSTTLWHYALSKPHASYLVMIAAGNFEADTLLHGNVPVQLWYHPEDADKAEVTYDRTLEMFKFLEDYIGVDYPWESYAMVPVRDFLYGGMENTTATVFGEGFMTDSLQFPDQNFVYVNAHELAHQWFGNYITAHSVNAHWVHESFATFYHILWLGEYFGEERYTNELRDFREAAFKESEKNILPITHSKASSVRHYFKGAAVISMLRDYLGDELFRESIKNFLTRHGGGGVRTPDLAKTVYETTGIPVDWFWDQWILRGGEPHIHARIEEIEGKTAVIFEQLQPDSMGLFQLPVTVRAVSREKKIDREVMLKTETDTVFFEINPKRMDYFVADPGKRLLMKFSKEQSQEAFFEQFLRAEHFTEREAALEHLDLTDEKIKKAVLKAWRTEESETVKAKIINRLNQFNELPDELLNEILDQSHAVQKSFLNSVEDPEEKHKKLYYKLMTSGTSYRIRTDALNRAVQRFPDEHDSILKITEKLPADNEFDFRISWIMWSLVYQYGNTKKHIDELVSYTSPEYDYRVRMNAFEYCWIIGLLNTELFHNVAEARDHFNHRLRKSACDYLKRIEEPEKIKTYTSESTLTDEQKQKVLKCLEG